MIFSLTIMELGLLYLLKKYYLNWVSKTSIQMSKTILITGTSQGIGHALTKLLLIKGYSVIGTSTTGIDNIN